MLDEADSDGAAADVAAVLQRETSVEAPCVSLPAPPDCSSRRDRSGRAPRPDLLREPEPSAAQPADGTFSQGQHFSYAEHSGSPDFGARDVAVQGSRAWDTMHTSMPCPRCIALSVVPNGTTAPETPPTDLPGWSRTAGAPVTVLPRC